MTARTSFAHRRRFAQARAAALLCALTAAACGGSDQPTLVIENRQGTGTAAISQVLSRACLSRFWDPSEPPLDPSHDLPAEGPVSIAYGEAHEFELVPGCHDFAVTRQGKVARARVTLDLGESATWVPFQIDENESWWCYAEDCP